MYVARLFCQFNLIRVLGGLPTARRWPIPREQTFERIFVSDHCPPPRIHPWRQASSSWTLEWSGRRKSQELLVCRASCSKRITQKRSFPAINYEDSNFNVAIPVFSIHGNHDDPQGTGPVSTVCLYVWFNIWIASNQEGALCALDVLSASGLINYMGKIDLPMSDAEAQQTGIAVRPVLLQKGRTRLGLYGIGNVKDQRMHFELRSNRVRMYMPKDKDKWFNILLLHQNRWAAVFSSELYLFTWDFRVSHGPQNSVPEGMFDDSVDLVVWGHEHDCRIIPEPVAGKPYLITQPGSSVATSLAEGEAMEKCVTAYWALLFYWHCGRHVALLEIQGKEFQLTPIPLRTTRPFVIGDVVLSEAAETDGLNLSDTVEITQYLKAKVIWTAHSTPRAHIS